MGVVRALLARHQQPHHRLRRLGQARQGKAVQLEPIKPKLKPPGTKRLNPKYDEVDPIKPMFKPPGTKRLNPKYDAVLSNLL